MFCLGGNSMNNKFFPGKNGKVNGMIRRFKGYVSWLGCLTAIFLIISSMSANAQLSGKGAITGTVTDSTGAVIPNASIAARNGSSGITTTTQSTGAGTYTF